jgi:hypothetical protein
MLNLTPNHGQILKASPWKISAPFDIPDEAFMAIELETDALGNTQGVVRDMEEFIKYRRRVYYCITGIRKGR